METLFVLRNSVVIKNPGYDRICYLDAYDFEKLERLPKDKIEQFIKSLDTGQVWTKKRRVIS